MAPSILVNGFGTVGKRLADAVSAQDDLRLAGVVHPVPDHHAYLALRRGFRLYVSHEDRRRAFEAKGLPVAGTLTEGLAEADLVMDATPAGIGAQFKATYDAAGVRSIFQGGEEHQLTGCSFNARLNFDEARGQPAVRVVSCNTTGLARSLGVLHEALGPVENATCFLVRRAADPQDHRKGPIDAIVPELTVPSHHGADLATVAPGLALHSVAVKVPATHMHVHAVTCTVPAGTSRDDVLALWEGERRVLVVPDGIGLDATGSLIELARDALRPRNDVWELCVWGGSLALAGRRLTWVQAVHQEAIVVPENVDCARAMLGLSDREASMAATDRALGIGSLNAREAFASDAVLRLAR